MTDSTRTLAVQCRGLTKTFGTGDTSVTACYACAALPA